MNDRIEYYDSDTLHKWLAYFTKSELTLPFVPYNKNEIARELARRDELADTIPLPDNSPKNVTITTKTGRRITDAQQGNVTHVLINGSYKALCGTEPGKRSDWSSYPKELTYREACIKADDLVTCQRCKKALLKYDEMPRPNNHCHLR